MRSVRWIVLVALAASLSSVAQNNESAPPTTTIIRAGTLIDGKSDTPRRDQVIVIRGNRIESVSDAADRENSSRRDRHRPLASTVLPGLIDSHTHIFLQGEDPAEGGYDVNF